MWLHYTLLLLVGAAVADHHYAWEKGQEYHFHMQSRTVAVLENSYQQFTGIQMKGVFIVQAKSPDTLQAIVSAPRYATIHKVLPEGWDTEIAEESLEFHELPLSAKPFEIRLKDGVIRDLLVHPDVPTWEVNILKSIASQMQIDTQGKSAMRSSATQVPSDEQPFAAFKVMEDSVGGKCEVLYDITPLPENVRFNKPELVPLPELRGNGHHFDITKSKNYSRCNQRMAYNYGIVGGANWKPGFNDEFLSRFGTSRVVISGDLKRFTIQSSVTINEIITSSAFEDSFDSAVYSQMNLTLDRMNKISEAMTVPDDLVSTGNLVYMYNSPFSDEQRKPRRPSVSQSSLPGFPTTLRSNSSSEESHGDDSSSSSSSSSSASNSEERDYLQPQPKLDEAADSPLLPYFVGYKGKSIQKSEMDYVTKAVDLIGQIASEIEHLAIKESEEPLVTLEKFAILIRLIRTMTSKQIAEVDVKLSSWTDPHESGASSSAEEKKSFERTMRDVGRDAVAEAGTGPALIAIKSWIKDERLVGIQGSRIVSMAAKSARTPTVEYIKAFFEMITDPVAMTSSPLNTTGPVAFADLVRNAQTSKSYYPIYSFGPMIPKRDNAMVETYIPYMADQLRKAIKDADSPRIQTYIIALGNFGHPKILSVFEPYLEGAQPITNFQRTLMVMSLDKLTETAPRIARSVLYKIYLNLMETDEARCMAVYLLMKTNPPLTMLQRMAVFTNRDGSKQVNSAVKSSIESLADSKKPEMQGLANKARIAKQMLTSERYGDEYSKRFYSDKIIPYVNMDYRSTLHTIGSDDSDVVKMLSLVIHPIFGGGFNLPTVSLKYSMSSVKPLLSMWKSKKGEKGGLLNPLPSAFNIQSDDPEQFEGNYYMDNMFGILFYPFDNHTIERIQEMLQAYIAKESKTLLCSGKMHDFINYDAILGFPTETGLPFLYTFNAMRMLRMSGEISYSTKISDSLSFEGRVAGNMMQAEKLFTRIGFIAPFEHKHYIAGIDLNSRVVIPADLDVEWDPMRKNVNAKIRSDKEQSNLILHYSVVPYTAGHDILDITPIFVDKETRIVQTGEPRITRFGTDLWNANVTTDSLGSDAWKMGISSSNITKMLNGAYYKKFDISVTPIEVEINVSYDSREIDGDNLEQPSSTTATFLVAVDKTPNSEARRKQFLEEVSKDINSATAYVFDVDVNFPDWFQVVFTGALASSNVDEKSRAFFYSNGRIHSIERVAEICAVGQMRSTHDILLDFEKAIEQQPEDELNIELRLQNCNVDGRKIFIEGNLRRSNDFQNTILKSDIVQKCRQEMKEGNKGLRACQRASTLAAWRDHMEVSTGFELDVLLRAMVEQLYNSPVKKLMSHRNVKMVKPKGDRNKTIDIEMTLLPEAKSMEISMYALGMDVKFDLLDAFSTYDSSEEDDEDNNLVEQEDEVSCTVDKTQVVTFDDKVYPLKLGHCWHVMMTTYSQRDPDNFEKYLNIPEELMVAVRVREMDGNKAVEMTFGENAVYLQKPGDHLVVTVNRQQISYSQHKSYRHQINGEIAFEIFELPDGSIRVISDMYEVKAVYDGERIRLEVSDEYRSAVRGLCGTYDTRSDNDFTTPQNCVLTKPEEFAATYAITERECEGPALENKERAEEATCVRMSHRQSNVISDREAGRPLAFGPRPSTEKNLGEGVHWGG